MMKRATCVALALALTVAAPARAEAPETTTDLKCLAFAMGMSGNSDPSKAAVGTMAALYFLGRIDGREPKLDLEKRLVAPDLQIKTADFPSLGATCGGMLKTRGDDLTTIGQHLQAGGN
jgi:hypothetical protein